MKAWKIIYPFIDKNTRKKVRIINIGIPFVIWSLRSLMISFFIQFVFVEDKDLTSTLLEEIDESQLPEIYGGKLPLVPVGADGRCTTEDWLQAVSV